MAARMERRPLAAVLTLGCKLNLADSEAIARRLQAAGYDVVDHVCEADAFVVNTCSVTHTADQKSRRLVRSVRRLSPGAAVTVTGCYPNSAGSEAVQALGADLVVGTRDRDKDELAAFLAAWRPAPPQQQPAARLHTRAFIKAQEGCNDVCAFCIVPRTRGREESRSIEAVAAEINEAAASGAREVVVTGTQLGAWGRDLSPSQTPTDLIAGLLAATEVPRVRFSSLQPQDITPELLSLWQDPRLMPHFHLALQSGSEGTLAAMRRRYTIGHYRDALDRIRAAVPGVAVTTDVIAGFPGESAEDFEESLSFCREAAFARVHAFPYSPRARTAAARMPDQVPPAVLKERMARLLSLAKELAHAFNVSQSGAIRPVLWESQRAAEGGPLWFGHTDNYIPVHARGEALANRITPVRLAGPFGDGLLGEPAGVPA
jgi:threonylcarbamoyladenosine tRNA methylthiotransferase MtaB